MIKNLALVALALAIAGFAVKSFAHGDQTDKSSSGSNTNTGDSYMNRHPDDKDESYRRDQNRAPAPGNRDTDTTTPPGSDTTNRTR